MNDDLNDDLNNDDSLDHSDFDHDDANGDFDDFEEFETGSSFKEMWNENPMVKLGAIGAVLLVIVAAVVLFGGDNQPVIENTSVMRAGSDVSAPPGTEEVSEAYREAVEEQNQKRFEEAMATGTSAIPVPLAVAVDTVPDIEEKQKQEDPLERWRRIQDERQRQELEQRKQLEDEEAQRNAAAEKLRTSQETKGANTEAIEALADAMGAQMQTVLEGQAPLEARYLTVTSPDFLEEDGSDSATSSSSASGTTATASDTDKDAQEIIIPAGEIEYAQLLIEANSDAEGPVLAQLVSGPLAGSRLIGSFSVEEEVLVVSFEGIIIDGISQSIDAIALDPETSNVGMATDVDHRYFRRVFIPAAAAFLEGMTSAIAEAGSTTVTVSGETATESTEDLNPREELFAGFEEASGAVIDIINEENEDIEPLIIIKAGTPMGVLFLQPVLKEE